MDFNTHKKYAKLDDGLDSGENRGVLVAETNEPSPTLVREMSEEDKLAKVIADSIVNKYPNVCKELSLEIQKQPMKHRIR